MWNWMNRMLIFSLLISVYQCSADDVLSEESWDEAGPL